MQTRQFPATPEIFSIELNCNGLYMTYSQPECNPVKAETSINQETGKMG